MGVASLQAGQEGLSTSGLFVAYLWVAEDYRGKGFARRILEALEAEAEKRGCKDALIETLDDTVASLYRHLGYRSVAEVKGLCRSLQSPHHA